MARDNQGGQRINRRKAAAIAAAKRRRNRRIRVGVSVAAAVAVVVTGAVYLFGGSDGATVAASSTTAVASAKGKPCVAVSDPLPAGAPSVPVPVGPPPTALVKKDLVEGTGAVVALTDTLTVNSIGVTCSTGKIFDSSYATGTPATISLTNFIKGWQEGIPGMKVGGQRLLGIPSSDAFGSEGRPPTIAPDEALWFVVEVVAAKPA